LIEIQPVLFIDYYLHYVNEASGHAPEMNGLISATNYQVTDNY